ncbi:SlyX family protein [Hirschia baltica]|uniref:SlyX family protein n=1 Tax=Hirschia baltica (strain ATCC 49814 / DSM 5838 / IFAM 1418) TaxID=582402 RepID=C6XMP1_HIRBI|nr:SlyX family protein [Hirschia baltica]ACT59955.1 SlyX family protein [Hirschia baltica ATCC 49814]
MTDISDALSRLDALEMRIAYQDETIEELNTTVTQQWKLIEKLKREIERVEESVASNADTPAAHKPPPHY